MYNNFKHIVFVAEQPKAQVIGNMVDGKEYAWNADFIDRNKNGSGMT